MPPQDLIKKLRVSRGIVTHVETRSFLHGKKVSNNNLVVVEVIATYITPESDPIMEINNKKAHKESKGKLVGLRS